jgi:hypothetical protein
MKELMPIRRPCIKIKNTILAKANATGRFSKSNKGTTDLEYKM